jgi:hypothetical protein
MNSNYARRISVSTAFANNIAFANNTAFANNSIRERNIRANGVIASRVTMAGDPMQAVAVRLCDVENWMARRPLTWALQRLPESGPGIFPTDVAPLK